MLSFGEKRRFQRVDINVPIRYKELGQDRSPKGTLAKNLSEGGVKFHSDKFISLACRMVVEMTLPAMNKPIRAISKVAWIRKLPVGDNYEVGNQFLDMTKEDKGFISEYMKKMVSSIVQ